LLEISSPKYRALPAIMNRKEISDLSCLTKQAFAKHNTEVYREKAS